MKRAIRSFEAKPDVQRMLDRAARDGIKLGLLCNKALRVLLRERGYARKKDLVSEAVPDFAPAVPGGGER